MLKHLAVVATMITAIPIVEAAPIEIDVAEFPVWCATDNVHLTATSRDNEAATIAGALRDALIQEARAKNLASIGLPFVTTIAVTENKDGTTDNEITFCSAIPTKSPKPNGKVFAATEPRRKGLAMLCDIDKLETCSAALEIAMSKPPWSLSQDTLDAATRRDHPALTDKASAENAIASLRHTQDILAGGAKTKDTSPALQSSAVVVALLVDNAKVLPAKAATQPHQPAAAE